MPVTTNRNYRYPGAGVEPDVNGDIQRLGEDVDADMAATLAALAKLPGRIQTGSATISIGSGVASATQVITFPVAFTAAPNVFLQSTANVAGRASLLSLYVNATTATQFTCKMQTADNANTGTSYAIAYNWIAVL